MITTLPYLSAEEKKQCGDRGGAAGVEMTGWVRRLRISCRIVGQRQRHRDAPPLAAGQFLYASVAYYRPSRQITSRLALNAAPFMGHY